MCLLRNLTIFMWSFSVVLLHKEGICADNVAPKMALFYEKLSVRISGFICVLFCFWHECSAPCTFFLRISFGAQNSEWFASCNTHRRARGAIHFFNIKTWMALRVGASVTRCELQFIRRFRTKLSKSSSEPCQRCSISVNHNLSASLSSLFLNIFFRSMDIFGSAVMTV